MNKQIELEARRIQDEMRKIEDQKSTMTAAEKAKRIEDEVKKRLEEETAKRGININNPSRQSSLSMNASPQPHIASSPFSSSSFLSSPPSSSSSSDEKKTTKEDAKLAIFEIGAPPGPLGLTLLPFTIQLQVRSSQSCCACADPNLTLINALPNLTLTPTSTLQVPGANKMMSIHCCIVSESRNTKAFQPGDIIMSVGNFTLLGTLK